MRPITHLHLVLSLRMGKKAILLLPLNWYIETCTTTDKLYSSLPVCQSSIMAIIEQLGYFKVCACQVI
jgi:hypothetical protein